MTTLGFRKNDYKNLSTDLSDSDSEGESSYFENNILFSDVIDFHDLLWRIWGDLKDKADEIGVPIFDRGRFPQFLNFVMRGNPYLE